MGGLYRIADFVLSNCLNSGLRRLLVLTQYWPASTRSRAGTRRTDMARDEDLIRGYAEALFSVARAEGARVELLAEKPEHRQRQTGMNQAWFR